MLAVAYSLQQGTLNDSEDCLMHVSCIADLLLSKPLPFQRYNGWQNERQQPMKQRMAT
jgi:hypothetical protein